MTKTYKKWSKARQLYIEAKMENNNSIVQHMFNIISEAKVDEHDIVKDVGVGYKSLYNWRVNYQPKVSDVSDILDYLGYELCIRKKG